jgi:hypothetical protein
LQVLGNALEDANFHGEAKTVRQLADRVMNEGNQDMSVGKGGEGSGNFGHAGREGEVGGSSSDGGGGGNAKPEIGQGGAGEQPQTVARTILRQMGGNKLIAMTGARNFVSDENSLRFRFPRAKDGINAIAIELKPDDTYKMTFNAIRAGGMKEVAVVDGVYNDQLRDVFTEHTGLETSLGTMGKGGAGSGNFGHAGRAGEVGGSSSDGGGASWESRVQAEEARGATRSDAQAIVDAEDAKDPYGVGAERAHAYGNKDFIALIENREIKIGDKTDRGTVERHARTRGGAWTMTMLDTGDNRRNIIETTTNTERGSANNYTKEEADKLFDERIKNSKEIDGRTYTEIGKSVEGTEEKSESGMVICKTDESKRMVYGIFLYPEEADHDGDVISIDDIEKVAHGFMKDYRTIDEMHKDVIEADIVESAIAWKDDLEVYGKKVKKGTWFGAVKVNDDKVWDKVKAGLYKGFSVRISGVREEWTEKLDKGGAGSGNFGHSGRAGEVGGSASGENVVENPIDVARGDGKPAKNPYGKTVKVNEPHAVFREGGWEWRVLKTYQTPEKEKENPYARWFCAVKSPMTHGGYDMGDTYIKDVGKSEVVKDFGGEAKEPLEKW